MNAFRLQGRFRVLLRRMAGLLSRERREIEIRAEIDSHLAMHIEDNLRAGMDAREARRQAILKLGGVEMTKQAYREQDTLLFLETLFQDLRFATRQLRRSPGFALTAVAMLALGMASSVAIFAFVDAALIKPLPYAQPNRLVSVTETVATFGRANLSYPDYLDWKKTNTSLSVMSIYYGAGYMLPTGSGSELVSGLRVGDDFFKTLGVVPILGRDFYAGEDLPSAPRAVMLPYATWQKRYAGRKDVIGQSVTLSGLPYTIVGVLPQSFQFAPRNNADFIAAFHATGNCDLRRSCHGLMGIGRLKDGVSLETANAELIRIAQDLERQYPDSNRGQGASVILLSEAFVGDIRPILLTLLSGAGLLLLIACVNVSSLLLVRSESRRREIAVRGALGASWGRISRQFMTEAILLVSVGSVIGLITALGAMKLLLRLVSKDMLIQMPYLEGLGANGHVLLFAAAVAGMAIVVFSVTPMLRLAGVNVREGLAEGSRGSASVLWRRLGSNLVVVELAVAVVLLVGAGLLGKSFYRLLNVDLGFQADHLATLSLAMPNLRYNDEAKQTAMEKRVVDAISALPGVKSAAVTSVLPVSGNGNTDWIRFVGRPYDGKHIEVNDREVSPAFFTTLGARLARGRYFTDADDGSKQKVAIVNETFVKKYYPNEDPIGKVFGGTSLAPDSLREIVGVVEDVREASLDDQTLATEYQPFAQGADTYFNMIVRASQDEASVLPAIHAAIAKIDPDLGTSNEATMLARINDSQTAYMHRSSAWLVGGFAVLALLLSVVGLYGVVAYSVSQRTREIGVRMALGAQKATVYRLILSEAGRLTIWGILMGLVCAVGAASLMRSLLFGTAAWDVGTLVSVASVLGLAAMVASYLPARRASLVNPVEALRAE